MTTGKICFTGHRQIPEEDRDAILDILDRLINNFLHTGYNTFRVGGALGFDMMVEKLLLRKRHEEGRTLRLELVLPCRDQADRWSADNKRRYKKILHEADSVEYICESYEDGCMQRRNRAMVDGSAICVSYCTSVRSGTYGTVRYAKSQGVQNIELSSLLKLIPRT